MNLPITYRTFNSGGNGGQHGNRSMNAIEATVTLPDGRVISATAQTSKSQHRNKRNARLILRAKVADALKPESERMETAGWGSVKNRVRTYHEPDDRVVDQHGNRFSYRQIVGKNDIGPSIDARRVSVALGDES